VHRTGKFPELLDVPVSGLYLISARCVPDSVRDEFIGRAQAGSPVTIAADQGH